MTSITGVEWIAAMSLFVDTRWWRSFLYPAGGWIAADEAKLLAGRSEGSMEVVGESATGTREGKRDGIEMSMFGVWSDWVTHARVTHEWPSDNRWQEIVAARVRGASRPRASIHLQHHHHHYHRRGENLSRTMLWEVCKQQRCDARNINNGDDSARLGEGKSKDYRRWSG